MKNYYIKFMFLKIVIALLNHYFQLTHWNGILEEIP